MFSLKSMTKLEDLTALVRQLIHHPVPHFANHVFPHLVHQPIQSLVYYFANHLLPFLALSPFHHFLHHLYSQGLALGYCFHQLTGQPFPPFPELCPQPRVRLPFHLLVQCPPPFSIDILRDPILQGLSLFLSHNKFLDNDPRYSIATPDTFFRRSQVKAIIN